MGSAPTFSSASRDCWVFYSDNSGSTWTQNDIGRSTAWVLSNNVVINGGFDVTVSGNSLNSGNSNVIYTIWSTSIGLELALKRRKLGVWDSLGLKIATASGYPFDAAPSAIRSPQIVSSFNGAVASIIFSDNVLDMGNSIDRPVAYLRTFNAGDTWTAKTYITTTMDPDRQPITHNLLSSIIGNVTNVFLTGNTVVGSRVVFDITPWTRRCTASSNNLVVGRDFVPNQNTWNTAGQHVTYTLTLPAFATGDFKLSQFLDQNIMQSASGPAKTGTVALSSVTFPSGVYLGSATGGVGNEIGANLQYTTSTPGTFLVWSTTAIPVIIVLDLVFTTTPLPGVGSQDFFAGMPPWNNGLQWSTQANPFVTYIGSTPGFTSSTENLLIDDAICVAEGTRIRMSNGDTVRIENLKPGDLVVGQDNEIVPVSKLIKLKMPLSCFYRLRNDDSQLLICSGHPILVDGFEVMPEEIGEQLILAKPKSVYTLITPGRQYVRMEGFLVSTWSQASWENFINNDPKGLGLEWT